MMTTVLSDFSLIVFVYDLSIDFRQLTNYTKKNLVPQVVSKVEVAFR